MTKALAAGLLLLAAACAHRSGKDLDAGAMKGAQNTIRVHVSNHYSVAVEIYAVGAGISQRLGTVHPGTESRFVLPPTMVGNGPVEFWAQPASGEPPVRSGELLLAPGNTVEFEIETHLLGSTARIRE